MTNQPDASRREFLSGAAGVRALRGAVDAAVGPVPDDKGDSGVPRPSSLEPEIDSEYLLSVSRRSMACTFEVHLPVASRGVGAEAALAALDLVDALESQMTVYRETSEIIEINRLAACHAVPVEERLFVLLQRALDISRETDGAFDITSGPLSDAWGFSRRQGRLPSEEELAAARARVGYARVLLESQARTVSFAAPGVTINFNSIGKGYALDRAAELLVERGLDHFLLHGGNSSVLGRLGGADRPPWRIGVRNPLRPAERLGEILLADRAVGTSGSGTQYFHHQGQRYGHLLDPRTGYPAEGVLSATVIATSGAEADALATAFYVLGPNLVEEYCDRRPEIGTVLVCPGGRGGRLDVFVFGASSEQWWRPQ